MPYEHNCIVHNNTHADCNIWPQIFNYWTEFIAMIGIHTLNQQRNQHPSKCKNKCIDSASRSLQCFDPVLPLQFHHLSIITNWQKETIMLSFSLKADASIIAITFLLLQWRYWEKTCPVFKSNWLKIKHSTNCVHLRKLCFSCNQLKTNVLHQQKCIEVQNASKVILSVSMPSFKPIIQFTSLHLC